MIPFPFQAGGFGRSAAPPSGVGFTYPPFANYSAALHFNGTDASTTFTDQTGKTWTANGNAQIDTSQSQFGGASGQFDGTGDFISTPTSTSFDYGTGNFVWCGWVRFNNLTGNQYILDQYNNNGVISYNGNLLYYNPTTGIGSSLYTTGGGTLSANTWYFIEVSRTSGTTRFFVDGVLKSSASDANDYVSGGATHFGSYTGGGNDLNGRLDDWVLAKGVGGSTANYTRPTSPFPDS